MKALLVPAVALLLTGCAATTPPTVVADPHINLPPRNLIVPDPEPLPAIKTGDPLNVALLRTNGALKRANQRLRDGATNYERLRNTFAQPQIR